MLNQDADDAHRYDDIMDLPHHVPVAYPRMPRADRAAQFSPFAALTGYGAAIDETARLTNERVELDEDAKSLLDYRMQLLKSHVKERPEVAVTYFQPDERKEGGAYVTVGGAVTKVDDIQRTIALTNGVRLRIEDIYAIEGEMFDRHQIRQSILPEL